MLAQLYRATVFGIKGYFEFTKQGYEKASQSFAPLALNVDLKGKNAVVTGANSGLGKVVALELAKRGANVHMICRNKEAGEKAVQEIQSESHNPNVHLQIADISRPRQVTLVCKELEKHGKVDILINNAGALLNERQSTPDGLDASFATNTLGGFILTETLLPLLQQSSDPRIVTVSSGGMYTVCLDEKDVEFKNMTKWDGATAYAYSKRAQVELTHYWATKYPNMVFYSMHPGWSDTPGVQTALPTFRKALDGKLRTPEQGADTIVWAAVSDQVKTIAPSGSFLFDRQVVREHLTGSWTQSRPDQVDALVAKLNEYKTKFA